MKFSLRTKLTTSYVFIALICVMMISFLTNSLLDKQFQNYVKQNQDQRNKDIVLSISKQYLSDSDWNIEGIENIGISSLENSLIIKVKDDRGYMIWDATIHNNGMCERILQQTAESMKSRYPNIKGGYQEKLFPVMVNNKEVATVIIGSYGPFYFSVNDLQFINTLNQILISVGVFSLFFAFLLGTYMARRLTRPISRVIATAQMIAKGYFDDRVSEKSDTKEIYQLTETVNDLATALANQETLRKRMTQDMAHELRTPLATLQSHLEAMIDGIWEMDAKRLESCHEEILRINRMVSDLEKLAKYESENLTLSKTHFELSALVERTIHIFESEFYRKGIKISLKSTPVEIVADMDKIAQVVINLISNSLKYTNHGGVVDVIVENSNDRYAKISVKDNGVGILNEDIPFIFERFYRADKSRNRQTGGSGIGLAIVKSIVQAHHGKLEVFSEIDKGTEFILTLPKKDA